MFIYVEDVNRFQGYKVTRIRPQSSSSTVGLPGSAEQVPFKSSCVRPPWWDAFHGEAKMDVETTASPPLKKICFKQVVLPPHCKAFLYERRAQSPGLCTKMP